MQKLGLFITLVVLVVGIGLTVVGTPKNGVLTIGTWNLRGYPETTADRAAWFSKTLPTLGIDILCVQEIANRDRVNTFLHKESGFSTAAFQDSSDGMDNAIFFADGITVEDLPDPIGFQHPAQEAYFRYQGLDAVIITVHLSYTDAAKRAAEKQLLVGVVQQALKKDPDVILIGDFNTPPDSISQLASSLGLKVLMVNDPTVGTTTAGNTYDYILVSPDLYTEEAIGAHIHVFSTTDQQMANAISDHRPVIGVFTTDMAYSDSTPSSPPPSPVSCLDKLNAATYSDFHAVYGIGDVLARRLVEAQPFHSISDLDNVPGIGPVRMKAILNYFCPNRQGGY